MKAIIGWQSLNVRAVNARRAFSASTFGVACAAALAVFLLGARANAAPINYGNFTGATVDYVGVTEDANSAGDAPPLFGSPTVFGDSLDFDPVGFSASAAGAAGVDVTDGNLTFMVVAHAGYAIDNIQLEEAGDTTLAGFGNDGTFTSVTALGVLNINEVDGIGIPTISAPIALTFTPSGGTFGLLSDGGGGPLFNANWSGSWSEDVEQLLIDNGVSYTLGATKISVNLDNTLTALSQNGTSALIAKKHFGGLSVTVNIPEPSSLLLAGIVVLSALVYRREV
jgi:hypothetical protein